MLHIYLLNTRLRCFERDEYRNWHQQLIDHFFFECEKKMHVDHNITSSALRQRYLKDIFTQFRGLLLAYDEGLVKGDAILASALWRRASPPRVLVGNTSCLARRRCGRRTISGACSRLRSWRGRQVS